VAVLALAVAQQIELGSEKANGEDLKAVLSQVIYFRLDSFAVYKNLEVRIYDHIES
jgi:hypothetical protein